MSSFPAGVGIGEQLSHLLWQGVPSFGMPPSHPSLVGREGDRPLSLARLWRRKGRGGRGLTQDKGAGEMRATAR